MNNNFLTKQYKNSKKFKINHNYLKKQFFNSKEIFKNINLLLRRTDFTLGKDVDVFEKNFAKLIGTSFAIGVGSGTDALFLSLKALSNKNKSEVIVPSFTFYATIGAIVTAGFKPIFVDINSDLNIDTLKIEEKINKKTAAILPVHWAGKVCAMDQIIKIGKKYKIPIIEDACHAVGATYNGQKAGSFGLSGCFSFHPLKNLNVWGDGGIICTNNKKFAKKIILLRNHGLVSRDKCVIYGFNSRLDSIQAIIANHFLKNKIKIITKKRINNAKYLTKKLLGIKQIGIPQPFVTESKQVYHLFHILTNQQKSLQQFLQKNNIDAKIHYPIPCHLQKPARAFGYKKGDYPITELISKKIISLPIHEFITKKDMDYMIKKIIFFFKNEKN
jgi:aminotransferase EvaB